MARLLSSSSVSSVLRRMARLVGSRFARFGEVFVRREFFDVKEEHEFRLKRELQRARVHSWIV